MDEYEYENWLRVLLSDVPNGNILVVPDMTRITNKLRIHSTHNDRGSDIFVESGGRFLASITIDGSGFEWVGVGVSMTSDVLLFEVQLPNGHNVRKRVTSSYSHTIDKTDIKNVLPCTMSNLRFV